ncbi:MAG: recombination protein RecR [Clostridia bacterium]|nr:recombination protein RecR [Clostridia bacterium]
MSDMLAPLENLIEQFRRIPSVGKKSATRMAYSILEYSEEKAKALSDAIIEAKEHITLCPRCFQYSIDGMECSVCSDEERDRSVICVVEDCRAAYSIERVRDYKGMYHVLHGVLSPLDGIGPEDIRAAELCERVAEGEVKEVIIATDPDVEGEATAVYITKLLKPLGVKVSRLAYGMSVGGDLEYTDEGTLARAISGRRELD